MGEPAVRPKARHNGRKGEERRRNEGRRGGGERRGGGGGVFGEVALHILLRGWTTSTHQAVGRSHMT